MKNKDNALQNYVEMIRKSWTWERLTQDEHTRFLEQLDWAKNQNILKGDYNTRWQIMTAMYSAFLQGCGYEPSGWRGE